MHLQDVRLEPYLDRIVEDLRAENIQKWVVNGTDESDWDRVARLADCYPEVAPCFGLHPWKTKARGSGWEKKLLAVLDRFPSACVGEIGLDKWIPNHDLDDQEQVFRTQMGIAVQQSRPAIIHCLKCFGRMHSVLSDLSSPQDFRFLLHSYSGPKEMIADFVELGAYFSFSGYFLQERKHATRDAFSLVPPDRLLIETDAPDMPLPAEIERYTLPSTEQGRRLNHPANLMTIYRKVAELRKTDPTDFAKQIADNFAQFFAC